MVPEMSLNSVLDSGVSMTFAGLARDFLAEYIIRFLVYLPPKEIILQEMWTKWEWRALVWHLLLTVLQGATFVDCSPELHLLYSLFDIYPQIIFNVYLEMIT
jgi:hypothetical protein